MMGRVFFINLEGQHYSCRLCEAPLALTDDLISPDFNCRHVNGYLLENVVNVTVGEKWIRTPGLQTSVVDIFCVCCGSSLGWKFENTTDEEGQFILERCKILIPEGSRMWER